MPIQIRDESAIHLTEISWKTRIRAHLRIMRLDHSIKNIFVVPGIVVSLSVLGASALTLHLFRDIIVGFAVTTLIACSNYVLNELLDAYWMHPSTGCTPGRKAGQRRKAWFRRRLPTGNGYC